MNNVNELIITRIFDSPVEKVWNAWTDPEYVKKWWGPKSYTCPISEIDLNVGGKYFSCMRSSDGKDYYSTGKYIEIIPNKKIVCSDSFADEKGNVVPATFYGMGDDLPIEMTISVLFEEMDNKTKMILTHSGMPAGEMSKMASMGWNESFDKIADIIKP